MTESGASFQTCEIKPKDVETLLYFAA